MSENIKIQRFMRSLFIFRQMSREDTDYAILMSEYRVKSFHNGEILFSGNQNQNSLAFVLSGKVSVYRISGNKKVLLNSLAAGDSFGSASLFGENVTFPTVVSAKSEVQAVFISVSSFEKILTAYPRVAINYISFLCDRIRFLNDKIDSFTKASAESRVAKFLIDSSKKASSDTVAVKNMSKIASSLGIGRATLYRVITEMSDDGIIRHDTEKSVIIIYDKEKIERYI